MGYISSKIEVKWTRHDHQNSPAGPRVFSQYPVFLADHLSQSANRCVGVHVPD